MCIDHKFIPTAILIIWTGSIKEQFESLIKSMSFDGQKADAFIDLNELGAIEDSDLVKKLRAEIEEMKKLVQELRVQIEDGQNKIIELSI